MLDQISFDETVRARGRQKRRRGIRKAGRDCTTRYSNHGAGLSWRFMDDEMDGLLSLPARIFLEVLQDLRPRSRL